MALQLSNRAGRRHQKPWAVKIQCPGLERRPVQLFSVGVLSLMLIFFSGCAPETGQSANTPKEQTRFSTRTLPGTKGINMKFTEQFKAMQKQKGDTYKPRTRHLDKNGWAQYTNRLFLESSPYLLQHAHNPVNWYGEMRPLRLLKKRVCRCSCPWGIPPATGAM